MIELSIVIPTLNEAKNIGPVIADLAEFCRSARLTKFELIVVDDGSDDDTGAIAHQAAAKAGIPARTIRHNRNIGYGAAIWSGIRAAEHEWVFFMDGDGQFHFSDISGFLAAARPNVAVIGYREVRNDPWHRRLYAWAWNTAVRIALGIDVEDLNCGYKLLPKAALDAMSPLSMGSAFNADVLFQFRAMGIRWVELPVRHYPRQYGKPTGGSARVIAQAIVELWQLTRKRLCSRRPRLAGD